MKRTIAFLLAALLLPAFAACKNPTDPAETAGGSEASVSRPSETTEIRTDPPKTTEPPAPGTDPAETTTSPVPPSTPAPPTTERVAYLPVEGRDNLWELCHDNKDISGCSFVGNSAIMGDRLLLTTCTYITDGETIDDYGEPYWETQWSVYLIDLRSGQTQGSCGIGGELYQAGFLEDGSVYVLTMSGDADSFGYDLCCFSDFPSEMQRLEGIAWENWCGISEDGTVWLFEPEENLLRALTPFDDRLESVYSCPDWNSANYCGTYGGTAYFLGYGDSGASSFVGIRLSDGDRTEYPHLRNVGARNGDLFCLYSKGEWMIAFPEDLYLVNAFPKRHDLNSIHAAAGNRFVEYDYDYEGEISGSYGVYDAKSGAELGRIFEREDLPGLSAICMDERGNMILACYAEDETLRILLWRYDAEEAIPCENFRVIDVRGSVNESSRIADEIDSLYGIRVFYDELSLIDLVSDYTCEYIEDGYIIEETLEKLSDALAKYPSGLFDEMLTNYYGALEIYLCGNFTPTDGNGISAASALTNTRNGAFIMAFNVYYAEQMEQNLAHELMHVMEYRLADYCEENDIRDQEEWAKLCPEGFAYYDSYHDETGAEIYDSAYTTWSDSETAWFIDPYSKSFAKEDRARVFEYLFIGDTSSFRSPHLQKKAVYLCELIRSAFPSVRRTESAPWELF